MRVGEQIRIGIDMDGVLADFLETLVIEHNIKHNDNMKVSDIKTWELDPRLIDLFNNDPSIFSRPNPIPGAIETMKVLLTNPDYNVYIATDTNGCADIYKHKYEWIQKHLPSFNMKRFIAIKEKDLLKLDVLLDDNPHILSTDTFTYKVAMSARYNEGVVCSFRINKWSEFLEVLEKIERLLKLPSL